MFKNKELDEIYHDMTVTDHDLMQQDPPEILSIVIELVYLGIERANSFRDSPKHSRLTPKPRLRRTDMQSTI